MSWPGYPDTGAPGYDPYGRPMANPEPVWYPVQPVFAAPPPLPKPRRGTASLVGLSVGFTVIGVFALAVLVYFVQVLPVAILLAASLLAFVPLAIVLVGIWLVDRWEPEPRLALLFAFLWGAAVAVGTALIVDVVVVTAQQIVGAGGGSDLFGAVVQAPIVEEGAKGFGVLLVLWIFRKNFDGPVDGVVYAATVAAGFAFVENIQYFGLQVSDDLQYGVGGLGYVFVVRALMSPFAHVMYTACTGVALGFAARKTGPGGAVGFYFIGLVPAILLHALWNGALSFVTDDGFFVYYLLVQVPIFVAMILLVVLLRRNERHVTHDRLVEYGSVGWFSPDEVQMLSTGAGRRQAKQWAAVNGQSAAMKRFVSTATRLAFTRQRIVKGRADEASRRDEGELLDQLTIARRALQAPAVAFVGYPEPQFGPGPQYGPGQQYPAQQYPGQQYPAQPDPGQHYPGQQYPGQQYPGQQPPQTW
ncbi:PrsW family intramembrane metalloprotease [Frigoribacterium sp. 2-23]|uniref:PrsW family intramembrane metalloprotease n=1 Tax=Frigoribacterium sp. 2-23 TaxID=3415006 RepID=UPI003C6F71B5